MKEGFFEKEIFRMCNIDPDGQTACFENLMKVIIKQMTVKHKKNNLSISGAREVWNSKR